MRFACLRHTAFGRPSVSASAQTQQNRVARATPARPQAGPFRLCRARMPKQFVKVPALAVLLPLDDSRMFCRRDHPLGLEHRLGPLQARNDQCEQPFHAQRVIVVYPSKLTQVDTFRIGNISRLFPPDMAQLVSAIEQVMREMA